MKMKITKNWIKKWKPCEEAVEWLGRQDTKDVFELIERLRKSDIADKYDWLFWSVPRLIKTKKDRVRFAVFCAELVLPVFESEYPDDKRPREAIQATKNWLKNPNRENRLTARATAGVAVRAARVAAEAADWAAKAADWAAKAAWATAGVAVRAARVAAEAAIRAAGVAGDDPSIRDKIIDYGIKILREEE